MTGTGRRQLLRMGRSLRSAAAGTAVIMAAGLVAAPAAQADPPHSERPKVADHERTVDGRALKVRPREPDPAGKPVPAAKAAWPRPGTAELTVSGREAGRSGSSQGLVRAEGLPIALAAPGPGTAPALKGAVKVAVLDRETARRSGVGGPLFTLSAAEPGRVGVRMDYAAFAQAFGGSYGARLRLAQLPACALTTPAKPECRSSSPIPTVNNGETRTLAADVTTASGSPTVLAAVAAPAGSQGDYSATKLVPSATWKASGNTGDFTWSYPMKGAPVPGGLEPSIALGYSAQSVDGRTTNTNSQPSWIGEGFDFWPGFIEQEYKPCAEDGAPKDPQGRSPGDLCWGYENATVTWNGKGGELVKAADGTWRLKNDDGTKFEKLTSLDTGNGDKEGEYWKVTTTDGTRYYFGLNRLPGFGSGGPETNSAWTVPVFGDDAGEPCHKDSGFADSWCQQAWRWNLDMVVDPHDNAAIYLYEKETNYYGRNLKPADATPYTRGGYLTSIEYGLRGDNVFAGAPPAYVLFDKAERCIPTASFDCAPAKIDTSPDQWWDVPWDMNCKAGTECKDGHGSTTPTFWSRYRLKKITARINRGAGWPARDIDSWTFDHEWGAVNDERDLLLKEIQHTGLAGPTTADDIALPKVTFKHDPKANRLDQAGDGLPAYTRYRLSKVFDESGGELDVTYSDQECSRASPPTPETNTKRCYPLLYRVPGSPTPIPDWFNKYVVTAVVQKDRTGGAPDMATRYQYLGGAAWHFDDDDGLTRESNKTWSQWRGYGQVRVTTGSPTTPSAQTDTYYLRGMHGDRATSDGGTKTVTVPDGEGGTHTDAEGLDGFELKTVHYTAPGGTVHDKTVNTPWRKQTATRTRSWSTVTANAVKVGDAQTWTAMDGGGWRQTKIANTYETDFATVGRLKAAGDLGDVSTAADDKCTTTEYADNVGAWMVSFPSRTETVSVACDKTPKRPGDVVSDKRTFYDGGGLGAAPTKGEISKTDRIAEHDGSTATYVLEKKTTYDKFGRPLTVTDAADRTTTTRYTDTVGLTTKTTQITPPAKQGDATTAQTTVQEIDPARGQATAKIDANSLRTDLLYDSLGRLQKVWLPDRSKSKGDVPNLEYAYQVADGKIVAVTAKTLANDGKQRPSVELFDGLLRSRQKQSPGPEGRLITDTFYDARGQVASTYATYSAAGAPSATLFGVDTPGAVETQTAYSYDGLGRKTAERTLAGAGTGATEKWRTTMAYGGNWSTIDPPRGGIPSASVYDARGQVVERRQFSGDGPTGAYEATTYAYDAAGRLVRATDPTGSTWTTRYDLRGRKVATTDPDKGDATYTYDDLDRETSSTDARGKKVFTVYDGLGRKTETRADSPSGPLLTSLTYDTAPRGKGLLATSVRHGTNGDYVSQVTGYDVLGRTEATTVAVPASEGDLAGSYTFGQTYNLDGTVKTQTLPAAGDLPAETVTHTYDDFQRPIGLTSPLGTYVGTTQYTPTGKPKLVELGTTGKRQWQTFAYEPGTQRLQTSRAYRETVAGDDRNATYRYDDAGNILSIDDASRDGRDDQCFGYDGLRRLTEAWTESDGTCSAAPSAGVIGGPAPYWQTFAYDKVGNRKTETRHGIGGRADTVRTYSYADPGHGSRLNQVAQTGDAGARTDTYGYDAIGNMTSRGAAPGGQTFDWDGQGLLTKASQGGNDTSFVYDAEGNRLIRRDSSGTTLYLPGTEIHVAPGAVKTGTRYYTHNGQTVALRKASGVVHLAGDHQGTAQIATNAADLTTTVRRFDPFGQARGNPADAWPGERGFVGGTNDASTGLVHLGAREYDAGTGRFISVDPVMDLTDPQQMNGYAYAGNSPVTSSDPDGKTQCDVGVCPTPEQARCAPGLGGCTDTDNDGIPNGMGSDGVTPGRNEYGPGSQRDLEVKTALILTVCRMQGGCGGSKNVLKGRGMNDPLFKAFADQGPSGICGPDDVICQVQRELIKQGFGVDIAEALGKDYCRYLHCNSPLEALASGRSIEWPWPQGPSFGEMLQNGMAAGIGAKFGQRTRLCNSFTTGTLVLLANGAYKRIEDVRPGDEVVSTDPRTGKTERKEVTASYNGFEYSRIVVITIDTDGRRGDATGVVTATEHHPFWDPSGERWVRADQLKRGSTVRTAEGRTLHVVRMERGAGHPQVHDLTVAGFHTFYVRVGSVTVLVHNVPCRTFNRYLSSAPEYPGIYEIVFNNGEIYVGSSSTNVHSRLHAAFTDPKSAVNAAGLTKRDVRDIKVTSLKGLNWEDIQYVEQQFIEAYGGVGGGTLINRRNEVP
ncbi:polymorphic toxin-type HINT domain-containing protein [Actinomadura syzygii]|uniref:Sugar-binding protein n=1 Tax=Actinomadura syzygii TaxID=1427538 RepID=A0A5D0U7Q9_9ACTN|nr:polymorphic toxin-type HINT domain-containing protein [Actinomadura syzygii]TYC14601.1 sugar-binding protein [Actinomadura syzygii]